MLFSFIRSYWFQNLAARLLCGLSPSICHNVEKLGAIRRAFAYTGLEAVGGDYVEFGTFEGTSLVAAIHSYRGQAKEFPSDTPCRFYGFDSFRGLQPVAGEDSAHGVFRKELLSASYFKVQKRLAAFGKKNEVHLVEGLFRDVLEEGRHERLGIERTRVMLIDCDLKSSARDALEIGCRWWQPGTVLILDDYFAYRGNSTEGVAGAFHAFCEAHPEFVHVDFGVYGSNGAMKIVAEPPRAASAKRRNRAAARRG